MKKKKMSRVDKLYEFLREGKERTRTELLEEADCTIGVLSVMMASVRKRVPEGEAIICVLINGRTVGYRWVILKNQLGVSTKTH